MDNEPLSFPMDRNSLLEDIDNPCELGSKELVSIEAETLISTTMDLTSASLVSSIDLPSLSTSLDLQSVANLPSYLQQNELSPQLSNINSALLLETVLEPSIVISEPAPSPPQTPAQQRRKTSECFPESRNYRNFIFFRS